MKRWEKYLLKRCLNRNKYLQRKGIVLVKNKWTDLVWHKCSASGLVDLVVLNLSHQLRRNQICSKFIKTLCERKKAKTLPTIFWCFWDVSIPVNPEFLNALSAWHTGSIRNETSLYSVIPYRSKVTNYEENKESSNLRKNFLKKTLTVKIALLTTVFANETFCRQMFYR